MSALSSRKNWGLEKETGGKDTSVQTHDIQRKNEKDWRNKNMGDWLKDPDEQFAWNDRRIMEVKNLLDRLLEDENIDHDEFINCVDDVTARICKALKRGN